MTSTLVNWDSRRPNVIAKYLTYGLKNQTKIHEL